MTFSGAQSAAGGKGLARLDGTKQVAFAQGAFMVATGLWPIVHLESFTWVTGPKKEGWLVKTVGLLISVVGGTLMEASRKGRMTPEVAKLGMASAAAFALVDCIYVAKRRISPVYLVDAVAELGLLGWWSAAMVRANKKAAVQSRAPNGVLARNLH